MSQLFDRIAKLSSSSIGKQGLRFSKFRLFSTSTIPTPTPYLLLGDSNYKRRPSGEVTVDINLYDPKKQERVKIPDQTPPKELNRRSWNIGGASSKGWVSFLNNGYDNSTIYLTNIFNPCASVSSHKVISLPSLSERYVPIISLSASPNQKEDCVVSAITDCSYISLCRLGDSEWTHVEIPFFDPDLVYSVKNRRFYLYRSSKTS